MIIKVELFQGNKVQGYFVCSTTQLLTLNVYDDPNSPAGEKGVDDTSRQGAQGTRAQIRRVFEVRAGICI